MQTPSEPARSMLLKAQCLLGIRIVRSFGAEKQRSTHRPFGLHIRTERLWARRRFGSYVPPSHLLAFQRVLLANTNGSVWNSICASATVLSIERTRIQWF